MNETVDFTDVSRYLQKALDEYGDQVVSVTDEALICGAEELVSALREASPKDTGDFSKRWALNKKYRLKKYVGNTKTVLGRGREIPLSNILEYSEKHGKPFIRKTFESSAGRVAEAIINEIKKGV